ncbi:MAG: hypothetical protein KAW42_00850, partial [Candidatus Atribacteria bacterium]|nr:hypothetical protein [Candidatus Atribacteria bacterium]
MKGTFILIMALSGILSLWNKSEEFEDIVKTIKGNLVNKFWFSGLKTSARSFFISALREETNNSYLIITDTQENALQIYQDLTTFLDWFPDKSKNIFLFPSFDILPYEDITPDPQIIEQRINILKQLSLKNENRVKNKIILITDIKALLPKLVSPQTFQNI